uniref:Uncharacterized protein n=1 Tax=Rhizophora mucronata TaxID=61149 RepID=A0A2P2JRQ5_RHIMU
MSPKKQIKRQKTRAKIHTSQFFFFLERSLIKKKKKREKNAPYLDSLPYDGLSEHERVLSTSKYSSYP